MSTSSPSKPTWLYISRATLFRIVVLLAPLSIFLFACKLYKAYHLSQNFDLYVIFVTLRYDIFWMLSAALFFMFWIDRAPRFLSWCGIVTIHILAFVALIIVGFDHVYFRVTGSIVDWHLLRYVYGQTDSMATLISNQITLLRFPLLLLPVMINLLPEMLAWLPGVQRWLHHETPPTTSRRRMAAWIVVAGTLFVTGLPFPTQAYSSELRPLTYGYFSYIFAYDLWVSPFPEERKAQHKAKQLPPLFNAHKLRLQPTPNQRRMNVVFIILESVRSRSITPYNPKLANTPFLAKLARQSLQVQQMYPVIPHTSKSLVTMFCGFYPKVTIMIDESRPGGLPGRCLPRMLRDLGYQTAFFQAATLGFERFNQLMPGLGFTQVFGLNHYSRKGFEPINTFGYEDMIMLKPSMQWLDKAVQRKKPFLLTYLTLMPHFEYNTPKHFKLKKFVDTKDHELHLYLNAIHYVDQFIEKIFASFRKRGLLQSTMFVIVGDHGEAFGEHLRRQHDTGIWEEMVHTPALIYNPQVIPSHRKVYGLHQLIDLVPTVADALGLELQGGHLPGISLLRPTPPQRKLYLSCSHQRYCAGLIHNGFKYIYNYRRTPNEIYNLKKDPQEKHNLYHHKRYRSQFSSVLDDILLWRERVNLVYERSMPPRKR